MIENKLPKDWKWVKLGDILYVSSGKGIKVNSLKGGKHSVYGGNGLNGYHTEYFIEEPKLIIGRVGVKCGVTHITKPKSWVTDNALIVEPKLEAFDIKFLKLKLEFENLNKLSVSTAQPVISGSKIYAYEISLPPKPTQQAIVSKIEELFSELDKGIENLHTARQQLKTYRQSVLKWAFEGRLTNENVKDGELLKGWKIKKLSEVITISTDKYNLQNKESLFYIGLEHIEKHTGQLTSSVGFEVIKTTKNKFSKGDVLYGKLRPNLNKAHLALQDGVCSTDILVLKMTENILANYIHSILISTRFVNLMSANTSGVNLPRVSTKFFLEYKISLPPFEEQIRIIQEIERRISVADKMEESITQSMQQAETLRQSILKKAFEGKII